jgi:alkanesulfonate monooxygenase SsuD/methylene tetrahydromethanopterin reductase-like flavin-dependent oxidoreductase (luciferase family)
MADDVAEADQVARTLVAHSLGRSANEVRTRLLLGRPQECADKLVAYAEVGAQRIFIRPVADPQRQLRLFAEQVMPLLPA